MFHLLPQRLNYTEARAKCRNMTGALPDVTSEQRTDALAQVLAGASTEAVFASWRRRNSSNFVGDRGITYKLHTCITKICTSTHHIKLMNYTEARAKCQNLTLILPDVTSEQRTDSHEIWQREFTNVTIFTKLDIKYLSQVSVIKLENDW